MAAPKKAQASRMYSVEDLSGMVYRFNLDDVYMAGHTVYNKYTDNRIVIVPILQLLELEQALES